MPPCGQRSSWWPCRTLARGAWALAYRHRKHVLNLYEWPAPAASAQAPRANVRQGYQLLRWTQGGMQYAAISDMAAPDLVQFAQLLRAPGAPGKEP